MIIQMMCKTTTCSFAFSLWWAEVTQPHQLQMTDFLTGVRRIASAHEVVNG
jgi:hypothetical protein